MSKSKKTSMVVDEFQLCGFRIAHDYFAIPVLEVQEIVKAQMVTPVALAPAHIRGLINLRGQIVTSISLRNLFGLSDDYKGHHMNVIIQSGENLYALAVDEILDVMTVNRADFELPPEVLDDKIKKYINGVYKLEKKLLIEVDLKKIFKDK